MPRTWHKADQDIRCGYDWCLIPKGQPYQQWRLKGVGQVFIRCEQHAEGPVDWQQIQAVKPERKTVPSFKRLTEGLRFGPKMAQVGDNA